VPNFRRPMLLKKSLMSPASPPIYAFDSLFFLLVFVSSLAGLATLAKASNAACTLDATALRRRMKLACLPTVARCNWQGSSSSARWQPSD
jgi:hypothetical protein